jgi:uncharacterized protein with ParB-like and HNH nuclease domain
MKKVEQEKILADILFPTEDEITKAQSILDVPPEQRRLHTDNYDFTVSTLVDYLKSNKIKIPNFQRRYVWSETQASRLIESLIIQCPIPVIYLSQERDETLSVIDGNQRLTTLKRYLNNEFKLSGLTTYPELAGYAFYELDSRFQRHIQNRTIRCLVILKDTHPQVRFDVFERLNTGSVRLTQQELRHGIYYGDLIVLTEKLSRNHEFSSLVEIKDNKRMKLEELILRFLAFRYSINIYKKPLSNFLNTFSENNKSMNQQKIDSYTEEFISTVSMAKRLYGEYAFKVFDKTEKVLSRFNAALFDAEMIVASKFNQHGKGPLKLSDTVKILATLFESNEEFRKSIFQATSDENQVKTRIKTLSRAFEVE